MSGEPEQGEAERQQSMGRGRGAWGEASLIKQIPESGVTVTVLCVILKDTMTLSREVTQTVSA